MTSFLFTVRGVPHSGTPSSQGHMVSLSRGAGLCEVVSGRQTGRWSSSTGAFTGIQRSNQLESGVSLSKSKSTKSSDLGVGCNVATGRGSHTGDKTASSEEVLSPEEWRKPLSRFSHFLREIARQDIWAGFLDPFQAAGVNSGEVNYFIEELKLRNATSSPRLGSVSENVNPLDSISGLDEQTILSPPVAFCPDGNTVFQSETRVDVGSVGRANDILSYASEVATGARVYPYGGNLGSISAPASNSTEEIVSANALKANDKKGAVRGMRGVPQAELCHSSASCVTAADIGSVENLALWLEERIGVSTVSEWGVAPGTKHVSNLWCELVEGEISLEDGAPPKRSTHVTSVKIKNDEGHILVEAYQEMADGSRRPRNRPLSEKMRPGEHVEEACLRGIFEELGSQLGTCDRVSIIPESYAREEEERESFSYPGLPTRYVIHSVVARIKQLPSTEFSTVEDESGQAGSPAGLAALNGGGSQKKAVGVKRHFWVWVPENRLSELYRR